MSQGRMVLFMGVLLTAGMCSQGAETILSQELEAGVQQKKINTSEAKFEEYSPATEGVVVDRYALDVDAPSYDLSFEGRHLSEEDQSANLSYNHRGRFWVDAGWFQTPHLWSTTSRTLYREVSPGVLRLPDQLQNDLQTNTGLANWYTIMGRMADGYHNQNLSVRNDQGQVNLGGTLSPGFTLSGQLMQSSKNGHQSQGFAFGRRAFVELAKPVDQTTYDSTLAMNYAGKGFSAGLSYGLNIFQNRIQTLVFDNTKRLADKFTSSVTDGDNSAQGRASLQPDNTAHNAAFTLGVDLPAKSRLTADLGFTRMTQNEELLPYTINSAINASTNTVGFNAYDAVTLPSKTAQTAQNLWVQNYQLSNRALQFLHLKVSARSEQLADNSKEIEFAGHSQLDQNWVAASATPEDTEQLSYRKQTLGVASDWNITRWVTLGADAAEEEAYRTHRLYNKNREDSYTGRVAIFLPWGLSLRGRYVNTNREASAYNPEAFFSAGAYSENPGQRQLDNAPRSRNAGDTQLQWGLGKVNLSLNGGLTLDKFKSGEAPTASTLVAVSTSNEAQIYGLLGSRTGSAGVDVNVDLSERLGVFAYYDFSQVRSLLRQNQNTSPVGQDAANDWSVKMNERYDVGGLGVDISALERLGFKLGYELSHSRGALDFADLGSAQTTKAQLPATLTSKQDYNIQADYKARKNMTLSLGYTFEIYNVTDYANDNVALIGGQNSGSQTNVFLGDVSQDYRAHLVSLMAKVAF